MGVVEQCEECGFDASGLSAPDAIAEIAVTPERWKHTIAGLTGEEIAARPGNGGWSIADHVEHARGVVYSMQVILLVAIGQLAETPRWAGGTAARGARRRHRHPVVVGAAPHRDRGLRRESSGGADQRLGRPGGRRGGRSAQRPHRVAPHRPRPSPQPGGSPQRAGPRSITPMISRMLRVSLPASRAHVDRHSLRRRRRRRRRHRRAHRGTVRRTQRGNPPRNRPKKPSEEPTEEPSEEPSEEPTEEPSEEPSEDIELTASWTGVTEDTITVGISMLDFDFLVSSNLSPAGWGDQQAVWEALIADLNDRGGIHGPQARGGLRVSTARSTRSTPSGSARRSPRTTRSSR